MHDGTPNGERMRTRPGRARAPGKVVISGAYVVLRGAPAIVSAVNRDAVADALRAREHLTEEVRMAIAMGFLKSAPWFDASALRHEGRKLGLGSSAAILVASLAAQGELDLETQQGRTALFQRALDAHRRAQAGGSGIDVAASCFGGTLHYQLSGLPKHNPARLDEVPFESTRAECRELTLPRGLMLQVWASPYAASTRDFLVQVGHAQRRQPDRLETALGELERAARAALDACADDSARDFIDALGRQHRGLVELGALAGVPICTPELIELQRQARTEGAVVLPAGAGGGDISVFAGLDLPSPDLQKQCEALQQTPLDLQLGAPGAEHLAQQSDRQT
jgi:phosphomevalonate kinase